MQWPIYVAKMWKEEAIKKGIFVIIIFRVLWYIYYVFRNLAFIRLIYEIHIIMFYFIFCKTAIFFFTKFSSDYSTSTNTVLFSVSARHTYKSFWVMAVVDISVFGLICLKDLSVRSDEDRIWSFNTRQSNLNLTNPG